MLALAVILGCSQIKEPTYREYSVTAERLPVLVQQAFAKLPPLSRVEYSAEETGGELFYEMEGISDTEVIYRVNQNGELIEVEKSASVHQLAPLVQVKIQEVLEATFKNPTILECERVEQKRPEERTFLEFKIRSSSGTTGYQEVRLTENGDFLSSTDIPLHAIETQF
jgi:hypothetical protein